MDSAQVMQGILESLGWAILHSFWQMALVWLVYQLLFGMHRKVSPLVRHHAAVGAMSIGTVWFIATFFDQYHAFVSIEQYLALVPETQAEALPVVATTISLSALFHAAKAFINGHIAWLSAIYLCMLALMGWKLLQGCLQAHSLRSEGLVTAEPDLQKQVMRLASMLAVPFPVRVHLSRMVDVPATLGVLKPVILLPVACVTQLSTAQLESILLHELAHIRRMDYLVNLVVGLMETLMLHNPFAWWFARSIRREREWCCDDIVLAQQHNALDYATALLSLEQQRQLPALAMAMASNGQKGQLLQRIRRITSSPATNMVQPHRLMAMGLMILFMMLLAWARPVPLQAESFNTLVTNKEITRLILAPAPNDLMRPSGSSQFIAESYKRKVSDGKRVVPTDAQESPLMEEIEQVFQLRSGGPVFVNQPPPESFSFTYLHPEEADVVFIGPAAPPPPPALPGGIPETPQHRAMIRDLQVEMGKDLQALYSEQMVMEKMIEAQAEHQKALKEFSTSKAFRQSVKDLPAAPRAASPRIIFPKVVPGMSIEHEFKSPSWDPEVWQQLKEMRNPLDEISWEKVSRSNGRDKVKVDRLKTRNGYTLRIVTEKESIDIRISEDDIVVEKD